MFYRGVNSIDSPKAEFLWIGADGTEAVSSRFSTMPRYNFYFYIYRPVVHNEFFSDVEYKWSRGGVPFHFSDQQLADEDYFIIDPADGYYPENIKNQVEAIINDQVDDFTTPHVIWMEGHDSSGPNIKTVDIIKDITKIFPDLKVVHSTLEDYAKLLFESVDTNCLRKVYGERRSSQFDRKSGNMYGYTTSARMYLKQKNFEAEKWIQFYAEPFNAFSALSGRDINDSYLEKAWELIVQNSSHDSIGGCSLDQIHDDMLDRYRQTIEISKGVFERSVKHIVKNIDLPEVSEENLFLVAFNPNNYLRNDVIECFIDIPKEFDKGDFNIYDLNGNEIEKQIVKSEYHQPVLEQLIDRPMYFDMMRYHCFIDLKSIPEFGYKSFWLEPIKNDKLKIKNLKEGLAKKNIIENDYLKIKINSNGTFDLIDKAQKKDFKGLGYFYDEGEAGHAWVNIPTKPFITTLKSNAKKELIQNGKLSATFKISHTINLPSNLSERKKKNPNLAAIDVDLFITLNKNSKRVEVKVEVDNRAESHRLRIMFPTYLNAKFHYGEGQFDVVKRSVDRPDTKKWIEQPMYDFPLHHFADVKNNKNGLAVLVDGLKEYEVLNDKKKTLAITLFRGFEYIIAPSSKQVYTFLKGSQCLGKSSYRLALYPHKGNSRTGEIYKEALNFNNHISLVQTGKANGKLPSELSFMKITPADLILSALKKSEDGLGFVLRIYNPSEKDIEGKVKFFKKISKVEQVTLEEVVVNEINLLSKDSFTVSLTKMKIGTYKIKFT
jgi:mannosylglycerate hydrolase